MSSGGGDKNAGRTAAGVGFGDLVESGGVSEKTGDAALGRIPHMNLQDTTNSVTLRVVTIQMSTICKSLKQWEYLQPHLHLCYTWCR